MSENQRQFPREQIQIEVELNFLDEDTRTVITRDVSQGGMFMRVNNTEHYTMGEMVNLQFRDPFDDFTATEKDAIIVRQTDKGIAVAFVEIEDF